MPLLMLIYFFLPHGPFGSIVSFGTAQLSTLPVGPKGAVLVFNVVPVAFGECLEKQITFCLHLLEPHIQV